MDSFREKSGTRLDASNIFLVQMAREFSRDGCSLYGWNARIVEGGAPKSAWPKVHQVWKVHQVCVSGSLNVN